VAPELSIVIPTFGNYAGLARVLDGCESQTTSAGSFEVLVVIDSGDPNPGAAEQAIAGRSPAIRALRADSPGASANRNAGWRAARSPLVLFIDNDTVPQPQLVAEHLAWHRREPVDEVAVLGHVRWARGIDVTPFMHWLDHGMQFDYPNIDGIEAGWGRFYSANISVKRALLQRLGGFDAERLPYGYEDLDLAYRASGQGLRVLYNRRAIVEHERTYDLEFFKRRVRRIALAEHEFVRKHPELDPWFKRMFDHVSKLAPARGRGRQLIRFIPRRTPLLGPAVWTSADLFYRQALAPDFLAAWDEAERSEPVAGAVRPSVGELDRGA
jgi:glycosyltransferase involved in cell wall biosynthesis